MPDHSKTFVSVLFNALTISQLIFHEMYPIKINQHHRYIYSDEGFYLEVNVVKKGGGLLLDPISEYENISHSH